MCLKNLGSLILHVSQNLSKTAMIWHWEAPFNLVVNDNMLKTKHRREASPRVRMLVNNLRRSRGFAPDPLLGSSHQVALPAGCLSML